RATPRPRTLRLGGVPPALTPLMHPDGTWNEVTATTTTSCDSRRLLNPLTHFHAPGGRVSHALEAITHVRSERCAREQDRRGSGVGSSGDLRGQQRGCQVSRREEFTEAAA